MVTFSLTSTMYRTWRVKGIKKWVFVLLLGILFMEGLVAKKKSQSVVNYNSGVKVCSDPQSQNMMETSDLKPVRINESIAKLEGTFEVKQTIQDWKLVFLLEKMNPLGGKEVVLTYEVKNICDEIKRKDEDKTVESTYLRAISFPDCPIPPGTYKITNMLADTSKLPLNSVTEGEYYITFTFYKINKEKSNILSMKRDERVGCLSFSCLIEPGS